MYSYDEKPYKDHRESPPISIYVLDDDAPVMDKFSCIYCKRTVQDLKGVVDKIITTPVPLIDFGIAINIRCKQCHQNYRIVANAQTVQG